jgi:hypothetical protein
MCFALESIVENDFDNLIASHVFMQKFEFALLERQSYVSTTVESKIHIRVRNVEFLRNESNMDSYVVSYISFFTAIKYFV